MSKEKETITEELVEVETPVLVEEVQKVSLFGKAKGLVKKHGKKVGAGIALLAVGGIGYALGKSAGSNKTDDADTDDYYDADDSDDTDSTNDTDL